jgi:hypothetical protein
MRFSAVFLVFLPLGWSQTCAPPLPLHPVDSVSGTLGHGNCLLSDNTLYTEYLLVTPTRGQIALDGASSSFDLTLILRDSNGHRLSSGASIRQPIERGQYRVLVNAGADGQSGDFTLRSSFTAEPGTLCTGFALIGLNQSVTGRLAATSCRLPDATPYEGYTLQSFGAGTLDLTLQSSDFDSYLIVRTADGHELDSSDSGGAGVAATVSVSLEANQTYTIIASAGDSVTGAYSLSLAFTPADGESCHSLKSFTVTDSAQGTISPNTSCVYGTGDPDANLFYNYYELKVSQPGVADLHLSTSAFNTYMQLLDASGAVVQADAYGGGQGNALVSQQLSPGDYFVQVFSLDNPGAYTLQYTFTPQQPGDVLCLSYPADPGTPVQASLSSASCRTVEGVSQVYNLVVPQDGTLDIDMQSNDFVPLLTLRDAKDSRIVNDDNFGNITDSHITADVPAGTYTVVAATGGLPGGYAFSWQLKPHALAPCAQVQKLDLNSAFVGVFTAGSCKAANGQPADYYQITTPADGTVAAVMQSQVIDAFLTLQTADGTPLRWDDNSYGGTDAFVAQFLPGQTYRLEARATDAITGGFYRLDVLYSAGGRPAGCVPLGTPAVGDTTQGTLSFTSCQYPDGTFADIYQFNVTDSTSLDLHLASGDFDAYLQVLDSKGNVIDEDDNSDGGTNAVVSDTFDPGTYFVVAKPFIGASSSGRYALTIVPTPTPALALKPSAKAARRLQ